MAQSAKDPEKILAEAVLQKEDSLQATMLIEAANAFYNNNQKTEMLATVAKARAVFARKDHLPSRINMFDLLSKYHGTSGRPALRHLYADSMIQTATKAGYALGQARGLLAKAIAHSYDENTAAALQPLEEALKIFQATGEVQKEALTLKVLAANLGNLGRGADCIRISGLAAEKFLQAGLSVDAGLVYMNMVWMYIVENKLDSAAYYNNKAAAIAATIKTTGKLHFLHALREAEIAAKTGNSALAATAIEKAAGIAQKMGTSTTAGVLQVTRAVIERAKGNYQQALVYDLAAQDIHRNSGDKAQYMEQFKNLASDYEQLNQPVQALELFKKYFLYKDSLADKRAAEQLSELNIRYQTANKEKIIAEQQLAITKKNNRVRTLWLTLTAAVVAILLLGIIYWQRRKTYQQSLLTLKKEQDVSLLKALMTGEEKERSRLARELHDGLGGILAAAQMQVSNLEVLPNGGQTEKKQKAAELVSKAASESRRIAHNLLPETLLRYGLEESLKEYCASITESRLLQIDYESVGMDQKMEQSFELSIYRIIQELINNIIKHSGATEALVQLHRHQDVLTVTVEDNGSGFLPQQKEQQGLGLSNIQSRISYLNGSIDIRSGNQKGTSVYIEIQLNKNGTAY